MSFRGSGNRGRGRGGRFRGQSDGSGGRYQGFRPQTQQPKGDSVFQTCKFYLEGTCARGESCRYSHAVSVYQNVQAHNEPVKSISMVEDGSRLLSGSTDKTIKIWNPNVEKWVPESSLSVNGGVQHIEMKDDILLLSVDVLIETISSGDAVGVIQLINTSNSSKIECKRSEAFPYTHPAAIRSFCSAVNDGELYLISGGGEGIIRTWKLNNVTGAFEALQVLEGHIRAVTSLVLVGAHLWSGSVDRSLRCWDLGTGNCLGVLTSKNGGHSEAITCLEPISFDDGSTTAGAAPGSSAVTYLASGGSDSEVIIWNTATGTKEWNGSHGNVVTCLLATQDRIGNRILLIGLVTGSMIIRSLSSMNILIRLEGSAVCHADTIWSMITLGNGYIASGGNDGRLIVWSIDNLDEPKS